MISRAGISPEDFLVIRKTDPMVVLREKVNIRASRNLLLGEEAVDTIRHRTVLPLKKPRETEMEIRTRRMVIMPKKDGEGEPSRMKPDSSSGMYVTESVEAKCNIISQNWKMQDEENKRASKVNTFNNLLALPSVGVPLKIFFQKQSTYPETRRLQRTPLNPSFKYSYTYPPAPSKTLFIILAGILVSCRTKIN